ncbi:hypothetical protein HGRIS_005242 [Hohenbuehelia grisea]|uniref:Fungal-type protein kinase domain-containing protein n=1 Tax=Hohenbuehelia grisea TaxID=104357 RepID=A0ABR3JEW1_9AGAR
MESSGKSLRHCESVIHFLKAMYDVLEAHRFGVQHRKILHRDINPMNILIYPEENMCENLSDGADSDSRPKFIEEVLYKKEKAKPLAILSDLEQACSFDISTAYANQEEFEALAVDIDVTNSTSFKSEPLKALTGTPIYIARTVSSGTSHYNNCFAPMPVLRGSIHADYELCYANDSFRKYTDEGHPGQCHGRVFTNNRRSLFRQIRRKEHSKTVRGRLFRHLPRHDAESTFWVIVTFLLRAKPEDSTVQDDLKSFIKAWEALMTHEVSDDILDVDSRDSLVMFDVNRWANALHPALVQFGVHILLINLSEQVLPEYAWLDKEPHAFHLHEAIQRILLQFIHDKRHDDPFPLDTVKNRAMIVQGELPPEQTPNQYHTYNGTQSDERLSCPIEYPWKIQGTEHDPSGAELSSCQCLIMPSAKRRKIQGSSKPPSQQS